MALIADKRELILVRLLAIGGELFGADHAFRNKTNVPEKFVKAGAFNLIDADEAPVDPESSGRGRPANGPQIIGMTPEIYILKEGTEEGIGTEVNALRTALIKAIINDQTLVDLCHNGAIRYDGFATNLSAGRDMNGNSGVSFTFEYALFPKQL